MTPEDRPRLRDETHTRVVWFAACVLAVAMLSIAFAGSHRAKEHLHASQSNAQRVLRARSVVDAVALPHASLSAANNGSTLLASVQATLLDAGLDAASLVAFSAAPDAPLDDRLPSSIVVRKATISLRIADVESLGRWLRVFRKQNPAWRASECTLTLSSGSQPGAEFVVVVEHLAENPT
jgi:hypothetical protein